MKERFSKLNSFVYEEIYTRGVSPPDIANWLSVHFGQCAEDLIVAALLRAYALNHKLDMAGLTYCELGGNHPIATSATYLLSIQYGMRGVIIEANPALIPDLEKVRVNDKVVHAAITTNDEKLVLLTISNDSELSSLDYEFVANWPGEGGGIKEQVFVPATRITRVFDEYFSERVPDYLSIDVEGLDLSIIQDLDLEKYRPFIIQLEPSDHHLANNGEKMISHMQENRYVLAAKTDVNLIFVDMGGFP
ncbi:FkbM family methyltransferase [Brucella gallinifaecis]|uniref:FkbM family methyltransferase n=1 Tax=Brucella gallinifaecis TaxID=215590 RepID=UPI0023603DFA|nr:FkbM family methyltransferase [Brucella gallinifaecis]